MSDPSPRQAIQNPISSFFGKEAVLTSRNCYTMLATNQLAATQSNPRMLLLHNFFWKIQIESSSPASAIDFFKRYLYRDGVVNMLRRQQGRADSQNDHAFFLYLYLLSAAFADKSLLALHRPPLHCVEIGPCRLARFFPILFVSHLAHPRAQILLHYSRHGKFQLVTPHKSQQQQTQQQQ